MTKLRFQLAPKLALAEKAAQGKTGFVPVATCWVIERSNAWMERCKRRVKNEEANTGSWDCQAQSLFYPTHAQAVSLGIDIKWVLYIQNEKQQGENQLNLLSPYTE
ncbi:MAG TPA: hypothetical protein V6D09_25245 [Leptolyngbyaceae cyanobacterium]